MMHKLTHYDNGTAHLKSIHLYINNLLKKLCMHVATYLHSYNYKYTGAYPRGHGSQIKIPFRNHIMKAKIML